jgi:hypothetical protein
MAEDLSVLVARLRNEGFDCRNLAQVGITIWEGGEGHFYPAAELRQNSALVSGPHPEGDAPVVGQAGWGQGKRGAKGYKDHGESEIITQH